MSISPTRSAALVALIVAGAALTACGSASEDGALSAEATSAPLSDVVPAEHRGATVKVVAGDSNPPMYSRDADGEITGITIDLARAAADLLGVELDVEANSFDASIPGLQSGTYDLSTWATDLTAERMAVIDQIPIGDIGYGFLAPADIDPLDDDMASLCGLTVAAIKGQTTIPLIEEQSAACDEPITISTFPDQASATLAVKSSRADVAAVNSVSGAYMAGQDPDLQFTPPIFNLHLTGIAAAKDSWEGQAFAQALQELVENGTYAEILAEYDADVLTIDEISVNPELG